MKNVLLVDASPLFSEFMKEKFANEKVNVTFAQGNRDAFIKIVSMLPDLIILEVHSEFKELFEFLKKKHNDPNATNIPIIASGPVIEREKISLFAQFGVIKYFAKPIKFDIFFESIGQVLKVAFSMDTTPCMLDVHRNGSIIFIEIAQGLNREKLNLLKYKLAEMIDNEEIDSPKVILMISDVTLSFVDGANLELLLDNVLSHPKVHSKNVKVLSFDSFTKDLVSGHERYKNIEVTDQLEEILNKLVDSNAYSNIPDLISNKILTPVAEQTPSSIETRFYSDVGVRDDEDSNEVGNVLRIAIVDDDSVILKLLENAFKSIGATCDLYSGGAEFLTGVNKYRYDLAVLDILMPGISGFDILTRLKNNDSDMPVIIYSQTTKREDVIQALSLGAKQYIVKPQKPEVIVQKALELLHGKI